MVPSSCWGCNRASQRTQTRPHLIYHRSNVTYSLYLWREKISTSLHRTQSKKNNRSYKKQHEETTQAVLWIRSHVIRQKHSLENDNPTDRKQWEMCSLCHTIAQDEGYKYPDVWICPYKNNGCDSIDIEPRCANSFDTTEGGRTTAAFIPGNHRKNTSLYYPRWEITEEVESCRCLFISSC